ncbi:MAG: hypothetical protein QOH40_2855 [Arthrobacter pascens]|nr:hypothetical protein [Arthrobacter pascens]
MGRKPDTGVCHQRALAGSAFFNDVNDVPAMHHRKVGSTTGPAHQTRERMTGNALKRGLP